MKKEIIVIKCIKKICKYYEIGEKVIEEYTDTISDTIYNENKGQNGQNGIQKEK